MSAHTTVALKRFRGCLFAAVMTPLVLFGCGGGGGGGGGSAGVSAGPGGGGGGGGPLPVPPCATTVLAGTAAAITVSVTPSRSGVFDATTGINTVSGVGPLAVFFTASQVNAANSVVGTTGTSTLKPFHDLEYRWTFGDGTSGAWAYGSGSNTSRNVARGPVAAHVFEATGGPYTVTLQVVDGTNSVVNSCTKVVVQDPNVVFAGTNTICVSDIGLPVAGPPSGCPSGALAIGPQADFPTIISTYARPGNRVLLRGGGTFTGISNGTQLPPVGFSGTSPGILGSYSLSGTVKAILQTTDSMITGGFRILRIVGAQDWRLMDLEFNGGVSNNGTQQALTGGGSISQLLLLRLDIHDIGGGIEIPPATAPLHDQIFLVDSSIKRLNTNPLDVVTNSHGILTASSQTAIMGNLFDDSTGGRAEHMIRIQFMDRGVVSNNQIQNVATGREMISLRATCSLLTCFGGSSSFLILQGGAGATRNVVISDNFVLMNTFAGTELTQVNPADTTLMHDVILERNFYQNQGSNSGTAVVVLVGTDVTVRNEIIDLTSTGGSDSAGISVNPINPSAVVVPDRVNIYNNTIYNGTILPAVFAGIVVGATGPGLQPSNVDIINNLGYTLSPGPVKMLSLLGGTSTTQSSNTLDIDLVLFPGFASPTPSVPANFILSGVPLTGVLPINGGAPVRVFSDFFGNVRPTGAAYDMGATEQ